VSAFERSIDGRLCICVGAGGVGKTTMAASIALGRAARGERVAVITIDPAPRLARALGFEALAGEPQLVAGAGELWAMRLDPKRTLDDLIASLAPDDATRERALSNRIYRELSGAVAGSQEFSAVAKLYELDRDGSFDAIVLDTPPSRNALDFLDAPGRLLRFFEGRTIRVLLSQGGLASRVAGRAGSPLLGMFARITGGDVLREISAFVTAIASMIDGLAARAAAVSALLRDPGTSFVLVSSPRRESIEEAIAFAAELERAQLQLSALVANRVHHAADADPDGDPDGGLRGLDALLGDRLAGLVRASVADLGALAGADDAALGRLRAAFPALDVVSVPELPVEVHDLAGLRRVAGALGYRVSSSSEASPSVAQ
jgi:anion-transporting  ArsA/GET3 family ATPase